jgi:cell division septation protein DedD
LLSSPAPLAGDFTVQVGAFTQRENAERVRVQLSARYMPIVIDEVDLPGGHFFRVRVGRVQTQDAAQRLASMLAGEDGLQAFVMRIDETQCCAASPGGPLR